MIKEVLLAMVCAMVVFANEQVILEIVLYEHKDNGEYSTHTYQLSGHFSKAGTTISAEGDIVQMHPLGLCNANEDDGSYEFGWVAVVKLEEYDPKLDPQPCLSVYQKAKRAIQRGATAVVFDVSADPDAELELDSEKSVRLQRPVIIISGTDAGKLMEIISTKIVARARIVYNRKPKSSKTQSDTKEYFDMGIFLAFFVLFCIMCVLIIIKLKWNRRRRNHEGQDEASSVTAKTKRVLAKLPSHKYKSSHSLNSRRSLQSQSYSTNSLNSNSESCAICLEEFQDGQDIRLIPCSHEFHKCCVDPWLLENHTCPLCMYDILEQSKEQSTEAPQRNSRPTNIVEVQMPHHLHTISNNYVDYPTHGVQQTPENDHSRQAINVYDAQHTDNYVPNNYINVSPSYRAVATSSGGSVTLHDTEFRQLHRMPQYKGRKNHRLENNHQSDYAFICNDGRVRTDIHRNYAEPIYVNQHVYDQRQQLPQLRNSSLRHYRPYQSPRHSNQNKSIQHRMLNKNQRIRASRYHASSSNTSSESEHEHYNYSSNHQRSAKLQIIHRGRSKLYKTSGEGDNRSRHLDENASVSESDTDSNRNTNTDISNESIYGSSNTVTVPSDISCSSFNVYGCHEIPKETSSTRNSPQLPAIHLRPTCTKGCNSPCCGRIDRHIPPSRLSCSSCSSLESWLIRNAELRQRSLTDMGRYSPCTVSSGDISISSVLSCVAEEGTCRNKKVIPQDKDINCGCAANKHVINCNCARPRVQNKTYKPEDTPPSCHGKNVLCFAQCMQDNSRSDLGSPASTCHCSRCDQIALVQQTLAKASYDMRMLPWVCPDHPPSQSHVDPLHRRQSVYNCRHCMHKSPATSLEGHCERCPSPNSEHNSIANTLPESQHYNETLTCRNHHKTAYSSQTGQRSRCSSVSSKNSMVIYSEPQGTVTTLQLENNEKYDPENVV